MKKLGPWTFLSRTTKYKTPWLEVFEDKVIRPDGQPGIYGVVKSNPGVAIAVIDNQGFTYLLKDYRYLIEKESIEVAGGGIEKNENYLEAAKRELVEELGITAEKWTDLGLIDPLTGQINSPVRLFLAEQISFRPHKHEGTEAIELIKVPFTQAIQMVLKNEITDGISCLAILLAKEYLKI